MNEGMMYFTAEETFKISNVDGSELIEIPVRTPIDVKLQPILNPETGMPLPGQFVYELIWSTKEGVHSIDVSTAQFTALINNGLQTNELTGKLKARPELGRKGKARS